MMNGESRFKKSFLFIVMGLLALGLLAAGCNLRGDKQDQAGGKNPPTDSEPRETTARLILYFSDGQAEYLVPEEREVVKGEEPLEELVVKELIKGPENEDHLRTIPEEARLLSLSVADGVAYVNLSREIQTKHWGGSTGEIFTVYSIVNSLTGLEGIKTVQFLVEGDNVESLLGHMDLTEPVEPRTDMIKE